MGDHLVIFGPRDLSLNPVARLARRTRTAQELL